MTASVANHRCQVTRAEGCVFFCEAVQFSFHVAGRLRVSERAGRPMYFY